ncbi:MAG: hypothetical protein V3W18_05135 [candidate division Zixibacteria bacterium]
MLFRYCIATLIIFAAMTSDSAAEDLFTIKAVKSVDKIDSTLLVITGDGIPAFETFTLDNPKRIVVKIENGRLSETPVELTYSDPIDRIVLQPDFQENHIINLICEIEGEYSYTAYEISDGIKLSIKTTPDSMPGLSADTGEPLWLRQIVSVDYEDTPLGSALSLLARMNGFDVVMGGLGEQHVTARLTDVSVGDVLDALLSVSGYSYFTVGDIVVVKPVSEEAPGEMITRVFKLNYLDARQIEQQIKNMISSRGKVQVVVGGQNLSDETSSGFPANIITVTDIPGIIPLVEEFINTIDVKPVQVAISVKLIETNVNEDESFGFDWSKSLTAKITDADGAGQSNAQSPEKLSAFSTLPVKAGSFTYGTLTISEVSALMEFLHSNGESRLLSSPSVTTTDGRPAVIDVVTTIPIQTVNRFTEGAAIQDIVTFQYKDIGISLSVTPILNESGYITLKCEPVVEEITGWVGPTDNRQPITSKRSVQTDVIVKSGETLVIGGLMKENVIENTEGIWLLSDIPFLGELFKHRTKQNSKTDLMILITPTAIR